jgi:hypothetical protein
MRPDPRLEDIKAASNYHKSSQDSTEVQNWISNSTTITLNNRLQSYSKDLAGLGLSSHGFVFTLHGLKPSQEHHYLQQEDF